MQLTFHGHACVSISFPQHGTSLLIDPGAFSDTAAALSAATAVLVTHDHPDHLDVPAVVEHLTTRTDLEVWGTGPVTAALREGGAPAGRVHEVHPGQVLDLAGARVTVGGGDHAVIHPEIPRAVNVTYLIETDATETDGTGGTGGAGGARVYHPGDSYDPPAHVPDPGLDVLLVPVSGPWMKVAEAIDFARAVPARTVVPIHDALLSENGATLVGRLLDTARLGGDYTYRRLAPQETLTT